jgi:hypothetical protein
MRFHKPEKVMKLPKGNLKDHFLKYNLLKLIMSVVIIFGGLYLLINVYFGFFNKGKYLNAENTFEVIAFVKTMKGPVNYYYPIVKEESFTDLFNETLERIKDKEDREFVKSHYFQGKDKKKYYLKGSITKEEYTKLFNIMKEADSLQENYQRSYKLPKDALVNDTFPVIYLIEDPDKHYTPNTMKITNHKELRQFIKRARLTELIGMFWSPLIPILGFLWLFFSVKHTYKRQQEFDKQQKNKKGS